jgi:hypothetical protein
VRLVLCFCNIEPATDKCSGRPTVCVLIAAAGEWDDPF